MSEVTIIGVDLAKRVFQLHGAQHDGSVAFRKKLSRGQFLAFLAQQPKCLIAMEACATAHGWGREDVEDGTARHTHPSGLWSHGSSSGCRAVRHPEQWLAEAPANPQATHGCRNRAGQQDGAWPLGHDDETRGLPESGGDDGVAKIARHDVPVSWGCEEVTEQ